MNVVYITEDGKSSEYFSRHNCIYECYRGFIPLDLSPKADFFYRNFNNMTPSEYGPVMQCLKGFDGDYTSQDFILTGDYDKEEFILVGAVTARRSMTYLYLHRRHTRLSGISFYQPDIGKDHTPEKMIVIKGNDWKELLIKYAELAALESAVKFNTSDKNITGYCTWYYYYDKITHEDFLDNLNALSTHRESFAANIVQIDDGYQSHHGDWLTTKSDWKEPLDNVASSIIAKGFVPGIWLMPLLASTESRVYKENPEWFVKKEDGSPFVMSGWSPPPDDKWACLDASNEKVQSHLRNIFICLYKSGFRYFKMDGMGFMTPPGIRKDPQATGVSAYREALKIIRNAVPDATLLGCCPPYLPSLGYIDSVRTSGDTGPWWIKHRYKKSQSGYREDNCEPDPESPCIVNCLHQTLARWWFFDRWFHADPDVVFTRQENTKLTIGECRISALLGIMTGTVITSDHLGRISEDRLALLQTASKTRIKNIKPHEWRPGYWPRIFSGTVDGRNAVAVFNDTPQISRWKLEELNISSSNSELLHPMGKISDELELYPHDAALIVAD